MRPPVAVCPEWRPARHAAPPICYKIKRPAPPHLETKRQKFTTVRNCAEKKDQTKSVCSDRAFRDILLSRTAMERVGESSSRASVVKDRGGGEFRTTGVASLVCLTAIQVALCCGHHPIEWRGSPSLQRMHDAARTGKCAFTSRFDVGTAFGNDPVVDVRKTIQVTSRMTAEGVWCAPWYGAV